MMVNEKLNAWRLHKIFSTKMQPNVQIVVQNAKTITTTTDRLQYLYRLKRNNLIFVKSNGNP